MPVRHAEAVWTGTLSRGKGAVRVGSRAFTAAYSFSSRFEDGSGSNPEELIGAAHAGCFSMAFAMVLEKAGFPPKKIHTAADVHIDKDRDGFTITAIELSTEGQVPGIGEAKFKELAEAAKKDCPLSKALAATKISLTARLEPAKKPG
jgi:lipoyl-dependent peroxiredoxin